jgi:Holliday junction resolvasome RuvABC ATP-dependent DNA helicase subunit
VRQLVNQARKAQGWGERFIDKLLVGPAGVGKSTLARKIGELLLGEEAILFNGADLRRPEMIIDRLKELGKVPQDAAGTISVQACTIFIDEVHAITSSVATALLSALDDRRTTTVDNVLYQFDKVVFLLATTDPGKLTEAFLSRPDRTYLDPYSLYELAGIIWLHAKQMFEGAELDRSACEEIAARKRCSPRPAVNQLNPLAAHFYGVAEDILSRPPTRGEVAKLMTSSAIAAWFETQDIDHNGLDSIARSFLNVLRKRGGASEDEIRRALGISNRGDFIEVNEYLTRLGLISTSVGGRSLTKEGMAYLSQTPPPDLRHRISRRQ